MDFKNPKRKLVQDIIPFKSCIPKVVLDNKRIKKLALQNYLSFAKFFLAFSLLAVLIWSNLQSVWAPTFSLMNQAEAANAEEKAALEKELAEIEKQIDQYESLLQTTQQEKSTLQNKVKELKTKAAKLVLQIKATNLALSDLNVRIDDTSDAINKTTVKISSAQKNLAGALEALYETDQKSLVEMLLASDQISEYFNEINALNALQDKIQNQLAEIRDLKVNLDTQKGSLEDKKDQTQGLLAVQYLQKQDLEETKTEQEQLLTVTKGKESQYQKVLEESRKKAAEIRSRIYEMVGVKKSVTFGEALDIATEIGTKVGVREALLLAILTQESNLGKNVGTCNRAGDPESKSWRVVMRPDSRADFLTITKELGLDPDTTPISCPLKGVPGWGGAMGPGQFMPKTWMGYKDKVSAITGHYPANPWDIRDAFAGTALYLANWGAKSKTYNGEWKAAMIYFSGGTNVRFRFYGDNVMRLASNYEKDIAEIRAAKQ